VASGSSSVRRDEASNPTTIVRRLFVIVVLVLALACVALLATFRANLLATRPELLGALAGTLAIALIVEAVWVAVRTRKKAIRPVTAAGRILLILGVLAALTGGTINWLLSLQGYVILIEGETTRLGKGGQLEGLETGPLGDPSELEADLALAEVELETTDGIAFNPVSRVETRAPGESISLQTLGGGRIGEIGSLRLRQGAFGYAPRLIVLHEERTLFDRVVPFTTRRDGQQGTSFSGEIHLNEAGLELSGEVLLSSLDERLKGHPTLRLNVRHDSTDLGTGHLRPGQFASLDDGYRVGFAGLKKWSEIDVARRNYREPILVGFAIAAVSLILWPLAVWRRW